MLGKDFICITMFLCTLSDFRMSKGEFTGDAKKSESNFWDEVNDLPDTVNPVESNANNPPGSSKNEDTVDVNVPGKYTGPVPRLWHHR